MTPINQEILALLRAQNTLLEQLITQEGQTPQTQNQTSVTESEEFKTAQIDTAYNRAAHHIIRFGKFNGKSLREIAEAKGGMGWLKWAAEGFDPGPLKNHIQVYLEGMQERKSA